MQLFGGGEEFLKRSDVSKLIESKENFDMNELFTGIRMFDSNVSTVANSPSKADPHGVLISFKLNENNNDTIQLVIDLFGKIFFRSYNASTGKWNWSAWEQIRGE